MRVERDRQGRLYESVETRGGIVLGFGGVVAALSLSPGMLAIAATVLAIVAALAALGTLRPQRLAEIDMRNLRERFADSKPELTRLALLDWEVDAWEIVRRSMPAKALRLRLAMASLAASVVLVGFDRVLR